MRPFRRAVLALTALLMTAACATPQSEAGQEDAPDGTVELSVLAFSSSEPGWNASIPAFTASPQGTGISITPSYGPSSDLSRSVLDGQAADVVYFADEPNVERLVEADKVAADWDAGPRSGRPFTSIVTLVVRAGNPKKIDDWGDLLAPGVEVLAADPTRSGSGKWALLAAYAAASNGNQDPAAGTGFLGKLILEHVQLGPTTVPEATDMFLDGHGDVLIAPEFGAIRAERQDPTVQRVVPSQTLRVDNQVAAVSTGAHREQAQRLVDFLFTAEAQRLWAQAGFRPTQPDVAAEFAADYPVSQRLWTVDDLGGWGVVGPRLFDPETGVVAQYFAQATQ